MKSITTNLFVLFVIFLITYPLFYFAYKYLDPYLISRDLDHYLGMYQRFDMKGTETPFNTRLISSYLVYIISKSNFYYDTELVFNSNLVSPQIYFSAFFVSYVFFVFTIFIVYRLFYQLSENMLLTTTMVFIYFVSFGNFVFSLTPLTDSCGYFLGALATYAFVRKSKWLWPILVLAIIQREYILLGFGLISSFNLLFAKDAKKFYLITFIICISAFALYIVLRKVFLYTPKYDSQLKVNEFLGRLISPNTNWLDFIKQTFLTQNTLFMYFALLVYKRIKKLSLNVTDFALTLLLLAEVVFFCLAGNLGNNGGRYFHLFTPLLVYFIYKELQTFTKSRALDPIDSKS